jgi:hypothetical protein
MGVFVQTQIAMVDGDWNVRVNRTSDLQEYISYGRAMSLADALETEGWKECAAQIRKDAATVKALAAHIGHLEAKVVDLKPATRRA